jgi:RNA 3'-terminal phosphate cyclase
MLVPYMALAQGKSTYLTHVLSEHLQANIWLVEKMLNARFNTKQIGRLYRIEKID